MHNYPQQISPTFNRSLLCTLNNQNTLPVHRIATLTIFANGLGANPRVQYPLFSSSPRKV